MNPPYRNLQILKSAIAFWHLHINMSKIYLTANPNITNHTQCFYYSKSCTVIF